MESREQKIIGLLTKVNGQTDRELSEKIYGKGTHPSSINAECNYLAQKGKIIRQKVDGVFRNYLKESLAQGSEESEL